MFDARRAKALEAGDHLTIDGAPGLRLEATRSTRTWVYRFKSPVDQRMRQTKIGTWPAMSLPAALAAWERLKQQRDSGIDPARQKRQDKRVAAAAALREGYTVRVLADDYLAAYQGTVVDKTYREMDRLLSVELGPIERTPASDLTRAQAFDLINGMRSRPVAARRLRQGLGAAWDYALDAGRLPPETPNWWRLVLRGRLPSQGKQIAGEAQGAGKRVLAEAEVTALLRWLPNFSRDVEDALTLYLWTCCRGAEIVAMERGEVTLEGEAMWWTVPRGKLKMRRNPLTVDLRVPLLGRARRVVERRLIAVPGQWIFPSPGRKSNGHIQQKAVGVAVWSHMPYAETRPEWMRPRLPVTHWAPHDLRRTGRTLLAALGCPLEVAEAILGHLPPGVQGVYNLHRYDAERRHWLGVLSERLESLGA